MTPILLATAAAVAWGVSDYCGGRGARSASPLLVAAAVPLLSLPLLVPALLLVPGVFRWAAVGWGAAAGLTALAGAVLLYRGLAAGAAVVFSPVTAVTAAVTPLAAGLWLVGPLPAPALVGAALAVVAIALVSTGSGGRPRPAQLRLAGWALVAGVLFGLSFVALAQVDPATGLWALVGARVAAVGAGLPVAAATRVGPRLGPRSLGWAALAGSLEIAATACFLVAVTGGHLSVVAVVASLYPAATVLLALGVDREPVAVRQLFGLGFAAAALVLVSL